MTRVPKSPTYTKVRTGSMYDDSEHISIPS